MQTIWLNPTDYVSGDSSLIIDYPSIRHSSTIVTSETVGDDKWILLGLRLPENICLEEVLISYQASNARSFISQVRVYELGLPEHGLVRCDEAVRLESTTPERYRCNIGGIIPTPGSALTLALRLSFQDTTDQILFGSVGVVISERGFWGVEGKSWFSLTGQVVNVKEFGAVGDGATDDLPAFNTALQSISAAADVRGGTLFIPPGIYRLSGPLNINRTCIIRGAGSHHNAVSILRFDPGQDGLVLHGWGTSLDGGRADSVQIRDLAIEAGGRTTAAHGIKAFIRFHLENVYVRGFSGNGIDVYGSMGAGSNANNWYISNCRVDTCGGHGLYLDGSDANAGVAILLDCSDNGGWGIYDSSFLGNTFIACHTAANISGPYKTDDANQRSLFLNCYAEEGQPPSEVVRCSMLIGGLHGPGFSGGGFSMIGPENLAPHSSRVDVETPDGLRATEVTLGTTVPGIASYLGLGVPGGTEPVSYLRYVNTSNPYFPYQGDWSGFNWARLDAGWSFMVPLSGYSSKIRVGYNPANGMTIDKAVRMSPAFPQGGFYLGAGYSFNWFGYWNDINPPNSGIWEETDILLNRLANYPGGAWSGWIGAICISGGTAGTYAEGRTATSDGTNILVLDGPSEVLVVGDFIRVNGQLVRISSIHETQVTVTLNIPTGSSLPISYHNPAWRRFGALEP